MSKIVLSLDGLTFAQSVSLTKKLAKKLYAVKIHDLFDVHGTRIINKLKSAGAKKVWVDVKLHDIPRTVALRAGAIKKCGADILTVHALGGEEMIAAAVKHGPAKIYAVTVLTSMSRADALQLFGNDIETVAQHLTMLAKLAGANGVVCSAHEVGALSQKSSLQNLQFIVAGVRSRGAEQNDQSRIDTPQAAIQNGASLVVIGREVTTAQNPVKEFNKIEKHLYKT